MSTQGKDCVPCGSKRWGPPANRTCRIESVCYGCNQYVDFSCCHCGTESYNHEWEEHPFVPLGCICLYADYPKHGYCEQHNLVIPPMDM